MARFALVLAQQGGADELVSLAQIRVDRECPFQALDRLGVTPRVQVRPAQGEVPQLVVGVVIGHFPKLLDPGFNGCVRHGCS